MTITQQTIPSSVFRKIKWKSNPTKVSVILSLMKIGKSTKKKKLKSNLKRKKINIAKK